MTRSEDERTTHPNRKFLGEESRVSSIKDGLFEACCYMQSGDSASFTNLYRQLVGADGLWSEALRGLYALGHIDVSLDEVNGASIWNVRAPSIVVTGEDGGYLQGFRSDKLIHDITEAIESEGGSITYESQEDGPSLISVTGISSIELEELVLTIVSPYDDRIRLLSAPHVSMSTDIMSRSDLIAGLTETVEPNIAQVFQVNSATWEDCEDLTMPGLFRIQGRPIQHRLHVDDRWLNVSYALGKHVIAALAQVNMMAYDRQTSTIRCQLGAPLPSPYDRIAIGCTGKLPLYDRSSQSLEYTGVPVTVASSIWRALYG